ncbi:MAG: protocatechuate 3,4-dioxygenase subunit alpha [Actinomycetota bacterium]|nr:protocatechuate 3,4-dioxygenase subunit alpha [Actinomycetota bacterium]
MTVETVGRGDGVTTAPTPSQTVGPFFRLGFAWLTPSRHLVAPGSPGALSLTGRMTDGDGAAVPDGVVELWQADGAGGFPPDSPPGWTGFGRCLTDDEGRYELTTVAPGPVDEDQAPHIDVSVFARGLLQRLVTRIYLPGQAANDADPVLAAVDPARRATLVAERDGSDLTFDIRLQGELETVFFRW